MLELMRCLQVVLEVKGESQLRDLSNKLEQAGETPGFEFHSTCLLCLHVCIQSLRCSNNLLVAGMTWIL